MRTIGLYLFFAGEIAVFLAAALLAVAHVWILQQLGELRLDVIILHLSLRLTGADIRFVASGACCAILVLAMAAIYGCLLVRGWGRATGTRLALVSIPVVFFGVSLLVVGRAYGAHDLFFPDNEFYTFFEDNYRMVEPGDVAFGERRNNLILLVLESVDDVMNDETIFGEKLMPRLGRLAENNPSFSGYVPSRFADYSFSGRVAMLLGLPCVIPKETMDYDWSGVYPDATSVLKILGHHGYSINALIGSDSRFGNFHGIFSSHAEEYELWDIEEIKKRRNDWRDKVGWHWGFLDSYLYDVARERLSELKKNEPFFLMIVTVNTHPPSVSEPGLEQPWGDYRDAFAQADIMADDFINWVREQDFAENTTIAVLGDHPLRRDAVGDVQLWPERADQSVYNVFINSAVSPQRTEKGGIFGAWDFAPTMLESVGARFADGRLGLGTSLFRDAPTVLERVGIEEFDDKIGKRSRLYNALTFDDKKAGRFVSGLFK